MKDDTIGQEAADYARRVIADLDLVAESALPGSMRYAPRRGGGGSKGGLRSGSRTGCTQERGRDQ